MKRTENLSMSSVSNVLLITNLQEVKVFATSMRAGSCVYLQEVPFYAARISVDGVLSV